MVFNFYEVLENYNVVQSGKLISKQYQNKEKCVNNVTMAWNCVMQINWK
jgi:hypothetical protein